MRNSRSLRKIKRRTPGSRTIIRLVKRGPYHVVCNNCGAKLNRARLSNKEMNRLPKSKKRPQRPFPDLCSKCMRKKFKESVR